MIQRLSKAAVFCAAAVLMLGGYPGRMVQAADTEAETEKAAETEKETLIEPKKLEPETKTETETEKQRFGITLYSLQNEYTVRFANAAADYAEEKGIELQIYDGNYDAEIQITQVKRMIKDGVEGLILNPQDAVKCSECVDVAVEAGIPIIAVNTRVENDGITSYVGSDDVKAGEMILEKTAEELDGVGNVVLLEGPVGQSAQVDRLEGIKNILRKYPKLHVIGDKTANWSKLEAQTIMDNWLDVFDRIDAVVAENDDMALGAVQSIKDAGLTPGKDIQVVSIDGSEEAQAAVKEGTILMTVYQDAEEQARVAIDTLLLALKGEDVSSEYLVPFTTYTAEP